MPAVVSTAAGSPGTDYYVCNVDHSHLRRMTPLYARGTLRIPSTQIYAIIPGPTIERRSMFPHPCLEPAHEFASAAVQRSTAHNVPDFDYPRPYRIYMGSPSIVISVLSNGEIAASRKVMFCSAT
jgi:hypothetical protein